MTTPSRLTRVTLFTLDATVAPPPRTLTADAVGARVLEVHPNTVETWIGWELANRQRSATTAIYQQGRDGDFHLVCPSN